MGHSPTGRPTDQTTRRPSSICHPFRLCFFLFHPFSPFSFGGIFPPFHLFAFSTLLLLPSTSFSFFSYPLSYTLFNPLIYQQQRSTMGKVPKIMIVGAGLGGLTLAILLERMGDVEYEIFERSPTLKPYGKPSSPPPPIDHRPRPCDPHPISRLLSTIYLLLFLPIFAYPPCTLF